MEYSKKNIPIPSQEEYKVYLISKVEKFIKRMRWKALQFLGKLDSSEKQTFGFRSRNCPPAVEELANFEDDLMLMTKNVEFRNINNTFQEKLRNDVKELRESDKVFVSADKSLNIYKIEKDEYKKLLFENVTKTYKKLQKKNLKKSKKVLKL